MPKVPVTWTTERLEKLRLYMAQKLSADEIAILMELNQVEVERGMKEVQAQLDKKKWTEKQKSDLVKHYMNGVSIEDIAKLIGKERNKVYMRLGYLRNQIAHKGSPYAVKLAEENPDFAAKVLQDERLFISRAKTMGSRVKTIKIPARSLKQQAAFMNEWWKFGLLTDIRSSATKISFKSADGNVVELIKQYTPAWKDILLKAKGLRGKFISVRMIQNYENTEPRLIDLTASEGIMQLAKPYPFDDRPQSFQGRYRWEYFGIIETKSVDGGLLIVNEHGDVRMYMTGQLEDALEERLMSCLQLAEGISPYDEREPLLICVDQKNPMTRYGVPAFLDAHLVSDSITTYQDDHNTIVEQLASATDELAERSLTLNEQKLHIHQQIMEIEQEAKAKTKALDEQFHKTEQAEKNMTAEMANYIDSYKRQERFLSEAGDALKHYQVLELARAKDKFGNVAVQMEGMSVVGLEVKTDAQEIDMTRVHDKEVYEALKEIKQKIKTQQMREERRKSLTEKPVEVVEITEADVTEEELAAAQQDAMDAVVEELFDDRTDKQSDDLMKTVLARLDTLSAQNTAILSAAAMTDLEMQQLRDFVREEEIELEADNKKFDDEVADILENLDDLLKKEKQLKVYAGHAKNTLMLRAGIDLTKEKPNDRIDVQFVKHINANAFRVLFPKYNHQAIISIVRDSNDKNDIALKNCMHQSQHKWKKAEAEVTGFGGKRIVGKKATPEKLLGWHNEICERIGV